MTDIIAVAAMTQKGHVIGKDNWLPWSIPDELAHFRKVTSDGVVIMGRKTWDSIGRPMPKRVNIVVSRSMQPVEGILIERSLEDAIATARKYNRPIYVIGGRQIYQDALEKKLLDKMYLSFIKKEYDGDTTFPDWDEREWAVESEEDRGEWVLHILQRKKSKKLLTAPQTRLPYH